MKAKKGKKKEREKKKKLQTIVHISIDYPRGQR